MADPNIDEALLSEFFPDIHNLFEEYNKQFFEARLGPCTVEWSDRMTLCAGICYSKSEGGQRLCTIRLSRPLLQYRPFSDTINTLLHEMIHGFIFIRYGGTLQRDGHGPDFQALMHLINARAGSNITVYHTFHEEVKACRKHVWRCQGPCQLRGPFYGWVRRSMNRPPQSADWWWKDHQRICGGTYVKISGPPLKEASKKKREGKKMKSDDSQPKIESYFDKLNGKGQKLGGENPPDLLKGSSDVIDLTSD